MSTTSGDTVETYDRTTLSRLSSSNSSSKPYQIKIPKPHLPVLADNFIDDLVDVMKDQDVTYGPFVFRYFTPDEYQQYMAIEGPYEFFYLLPTKLLPQGQLFCMFSALKIDGSGLFSCAVRWSPNSRTFYLDQNKSNFGQYANLKDMLRKLKLHQVTTLQCNGKTVQVATKHLVKFNPARIVTV